jgi:lipoprotein-anchoring transpeptidase ErfK/SrfK
LGIMAKFGLGKSEADKVGSSPFHFVSSLVQTIKNRKRHKLYRKPTRIAYATDEALGTIIINTAECALYRIVGNGQAMRYSVTVGKPGFTWVGTTRVARKAIDPRWVPPWAMVQRSPEFAKWSKGIPGGHPENPMGSRALYLYDGDQDTSYRIHGTIYPGSVGIAASSGCIRMLNEDVCALYEVVDLDTKVIVI